MAKRRLFVLLICYLKKERCLGEMAGGLISVTAWLHKEDGERSVLSAMVCGTVCSIILTASPPVIGRQSELQQDLDEQIKGARYDGGKT